MQNKSIWQDILFARCHSLPGDITVETVVVGAGLCGLLCAYRLVEMGAEPSKIAIIDANTVCSGVTPHTTAKITSQHHLIYDKLINGLDERRAKQYADANEDAIRDYKKIIEAEQISCDFTTSSAYVYTTERENLSKIEKEVAAAEKLGISASFTTETELPFEIKGAVKFNNQASFHPLKFAHKIYTILNEKGCQFYENTKALSAEESTVVTDKGKIFAQNIIISSHFPFVDKRGLYFIKLYQERSYALALKKAQKMKNMYIDCNTNGLTFRGYHDGRNDIVLFGGQTHKSGHERDISHYVELIEEASNLYPECEVYMKWSAQDCMTHDNVPYIGRYGSIGERVFVATGFNKWGMTTSMAASNIIGDLIDKGNCENSEVFSPSRVAPKIQAASFLKESADIVAGFTKKIFKISMDNVRDIENETGKIIECGGRKLGVYRDENGELHAVDPTCTHMKCGLEWNSDEKSWDCRCHGSRFDIDGKVIGNPAQKDLDQYEITFSE